MAGKPAVKVYGKKKQTAAATLPEYLDLAAFWVNDDGKLGGQWSRDILKMRVKDRDGVVHDLDAAALASYFCNLRDDREAAPAPRARPAAAPGAFRSGRAEPVNDAPPDFGDDEDPLPF